MDVPFNYLTYAKADLIVNARIIGYHKIRMKDPISDQFREFGVLRLEPVRTGSNLSGVEAYVGSPFINGPFTAFWRSEMSRLPDHWNGPKDVVVGLDLGVLPDGSFQALLAEENCSSPAALENSKETWTRIGAALRAAANQPDRCKHFADNHGIDYCR